MCCLFEHVIITCLFEHVAVTHTRCNVHTSLKIKLTFFQILACEPKIALIFSSTELYEDHNFSITSNNHKSRRTNHRPARRRRVEIHEYLSSVLPPGCQLTGVASSGVVGL